MFVAHAQVPGPAHGQHRRAGDRGVPARARTLLGGGASISDGFALPGSQGDHLTGSYPSDAPGTPVGVRRRRARGRPRRTPAASTRAA